MLTVSLCLRRAEANAPLRARQLRIELEQLGPAYVKVAQAVSTRVDILSPAYLLEIELLQDRVPPFPSSDAIKCIESAIGQSVRKAFTRISSEPVASASLGQVCPWAHVAWQKVRAAFAQMQIGTNLRGCGHHHMPAMQRELHACQQHACSPPAERLSRRSGLHVHRTCRQSPCAAQVYRGTLNADLGGAEVAVKVQRPHVLAAVALDLFLMRWVAIASQRLPQACALDRPCACGTWCTVPGSHVCLHVPGCRCMS